jgi:hypothetical protein
MLQKIERLAYISVARGCGFAALAIVTFMVGLSGDMVSSLEAGGSLALLVCPGSSTIAATSVRRCG